MSFAAQTRNLKVVGDYELLEVLGQGGMGVVYRCKKTTDGEVAAIKLLPPDRNSSGGGGGGIRVRRFEQEFRAALRLDHPNIVKVLDFGSTKNIHYLVMELVEGQSLGARLEEQGKLREAEAVELIRQVAAGLGQAHEAGLVHRDVKPDNILLGPGGVAKLTDLGLVKILD